MAGGRGRREESNEHRLAMTKRGDGELSAGFPASQRLPELRPVAAREIAVPRESPMDAPARGRSKTVYKSADRLWQHGTISS